MPFGFDDIAFGAAAVAYVNADGSNELLRNCKVLAHPAPGIYDLELAEPLKEDEAIITGTLRGILVPAVAIKVSDISDTVKRVLTQDCNGLGVDSDFNVTIYRLLSE